MNKEKLVELEKLIDKQKDEILSFFDDSHIGQQLDELHKIYYEASLSVIHTALATETKYKDHFKPKKAKKVDNNPF